MATVEPANVAAQPTRVAACENCGTELLGAYCHQCGQSAEKPPHSIRKLIADLVSDVFNFNSRALRACDS